MTRVKIQLLLLALVRRLQLMLYSRRTRARRRSKLIEGQPRLTLAWHMNTLQFNRTDWGFPWAGKGTHKGTSISRVITGKTTILWSHGLIKALELFWWTLLITSQRWWPSLGMSQNSSVWEAVTSTTERDRTSMHYKLSCYDNTTQGRSARICLWANPPNWICTYLSNVIYLYNCAYGHKYVGRTTQRLEERIKQYVPASLSASARCPEDKERTKRKKRQLKVLTLAQAGLKAEARCRSLSPRRTRRQRWSWEEEEEEEEEEGYDKKLAQEQMLGYFDCKLGVWRRPRPCSDT